MLNRLKECLDLFSNDSVSVIVEVQAVNRVLFSDLLIVGVETEVLIHIEYGVHTFVAVTSFVSSGT